MTIKRVCVVAVAALSVTACTPNDIGLGSAAKANYAAHVVNPEPVYESAALAGGSQAAAAQERYRKGTVKKPLGVKTTSSGSGSGSSSSSSSGN